jgi:hypothetical protein
VEVAPLQPDVKLIDLRLAEAFEDLEFLEILAVDAYGFFRHLE